MTTHFPPDIAERLRAARANFGRAGIRLVIDPPDENDRVRVFIHQPDSPQLARALTDTELHERAVDVFAGTDYRPEITVTPSAKYAIDRTDSEGLCVRRLVEPYHVARIARGEGTPALKLRKHPDAYHLVAVTDMNPGTLKNLAKTATSLIIRNQLYNLLSNAR
jgi:hypothetical protein